MVETHDSSGNRIPFTDLVKNMWNDDEYQKLRPSVRAVIFAIFVPMGLVQGTWLNIKDKLKK